jgi:hypothetical protein
MGKKQDWTKTKAQTADQQKKVGLGLLRKIKCTLFHANGGSIKSWQR